MLDPAVKAFLSEPYVAVVSVVRPDGSLHSSVVWVEIDGDTVSFNTEIGRAKERHLRGNPQVSLTVVDPENPRRWVAISGTAEMTDDGALEQSERLARKYLRRKFHRWDRHTGDRVTVRVVNSRISSYGITPDRRG